MDLKRYINAQRTFYSIALAEIKSGRKRSHWMWFIFPQIHCLGSSRTSIYYAIKNIDEAQKYLQHQILGNRLLEISELLLHIEGNNATEFLGTPDDMKLRSSMTLFASLQNTAPVFEMVLKKFFNSERDTKTLEIIIRK
ncbi:MAG: DUF1810 domain-containing protein [Ferruginibacter sp.]